MVLSQMNTLILNMSSSWRTTKASVSTLPCSSESNLTGGSAADTTTASSSHSPVVVATDQQKMIDPDSEWFIEQHHNIDDDDDNDDSDSFFSARSISISSDDYGDDNNDMDFIVQPGQVQRRNAACLDARTLIRAGTAKPSNLSLGDSITNLPKKGSKLSQKKKLTQGGAIAAVIAANKLKRKSSSPQKADAMVVHPRRGSMAELPMWFTETFKFGRNVVYSSIHGNFNTIGEALNDTISSADPEFRNTLSTILINADFENDDDDQVESRSSSNNNNNIKSKLLVEKTIEFLEFIKEERRKDWLNSLQCLDPRQQILIYFNKVARDGGVITTTTTSSSSCSSTCSSDISIENDNNNGNYINNSTAQHQQEKEEISPLLRFFDKASAFSVWRPTSRDAIKKMIAGDAAGKGLDVKGKSSKTGILSGFVPFVQIHEEQHKKKIRWPPRDGRIRIYYKSFTARRAAKQVLIKVSYEMKTAVAKAKAVLDDDNSDKYEEEELEKAMEKLIFEVPDSKVYIIDDFIKESKYGIDVAERVFCEAYIKRQDLSRKLNKEFETGRPSEPAFQDMNFSCMRSYKGIGSRPVILQYLEADNDAMCPQTLVVAYEEEGNVIPVASDFDCFMVGTRGVPFTEPLPKEQVELVKWMISQVELILESPLSEKSWTSRWLDVLMKKSASSSSSKTTMPRYGFGDPQSYSIMEGAVGHLKMNGAVRHGAECFNFYFPQELDEEFLIVSDTLPGKVPWKYVTAPELRSILLDKIDEGFTFPLNPKWILCDDGWKEVYDKLLTSTNSNTQSSLNAWYPPESSIRERIEQIYTKYPNGFQRLVCNKTLLGIADDEVEGTEAMDLAEQQLKYHLILQRAKTKLRCALMFNKLHGLKQSTRKVVHEQSSDDQTRSNVNKSCDDDQSNITTPRKVRSFGVGTWELHTDISFS